MRLSKCTSDIYAISNIRGCLIRGFNLNKLGMCIYIIWIWCYVCTSLIHLHIHIYIYIYTYIHTYITVHTYIHYITLHYITLHYITLHYITLHYITYIHTYIHIIHIIFYIYINTLYMSLCISYIYVCTYTVYMGYLHRVTWGYQHRSHSDRRGASSSFRIWSATSWTQGGHLVNNKISIIVWMYNI